MNERIEQAAYDEYPEVKTKTYGMLPGGDLIEIDLNIQSRNGFIRGAKWLLSHQWISVDEELPKDEAIFTNGLSVGIGHLTDDMDCDCYNGVLICGVTHWAEIPKFNE